MTSQPKQIEELKTQTAELVRLLRIARGHFNRESQLRKDINKLLGITE